MEDLTLEDLKIIDGWGRICMHDGYDEPQQQLHTRIHKRIEELEELNNLDLDDCAGGACKL